MTQVWPPSPCVEDEEVSLAKEHLLDVPIHQLKTDNQPAGSRGSVNQYPIIVDSDDPDAANKQHDSNSDNVRSKKHKESADTDAPANTEKRFILVSDKTALEEEPTSETFHRSKSTTQLDKQEAQKERPQVSRIHTDFGPGLDGPTARWRQPSSYPHTSQPMPGSVSGGPQSGPNLLSPMDVHRPRRSRSVHQATRPAHNDSSDSEHVSKSKRSHERSRSTARKQSYPQSDRSDTEYMKSPTQSRSDRKTTDGFSSRAQRYRSPAPSKGGFVGYSYTSQEHITPPQSPKPMLEHTPSSILDWNASGYPSSRRGTGQLISESPYTSSAEERRSRKQGSEDEKRNRRASRSRRRSHYYPQEGDKPSMSRATSRRRERGFKDESNRGSFSSDERARREQHIPLSARTPKAMEDYFNRALSVKQSRRSGHNNDHSRPVSPLASPPESPPRTPRGDKAPREYFEPPLSTANTSKPRSRPPSVDDSYFNNLKPLTTLLGAATLGASLASKAMPSSSRSSTSLSTLETPSSGSQSRPNSGQRSRKPSPVSEEVPKVTYTLSRNNSFASKDEGQPTRTTTYAIHEDRTLQKTSTYVPAPVESPRTATRAASYSYPLEAPRPPAPYRAMSTTSTQAFQQYLHVTTQQPVVSAPVSPEVVSTPSTVPPRSSVPPLCPRSSPIAGLSDWYTIREMPFLDFCPSCMSFLGGTRFRDHFIPSLPKDSRRPVLCAMSRPWIRLAWMQSVKQERKDLSLVWDLSSPPPEGTRPCPGSEPEHRRWYHLTDPRTKRPVEGFNICSACVMKVDLTFPQLRSHLFDRPRDKLNEEKVCNLSSTSRHFWSILAELERLAERRHREQLRQRDIQDFVEYIRRMSRHRECAKDAMLATASWHFIPDLPEFTICEECFEEVVWPLRDWPIAREVSKTLKIVPNLRRSQLLPGISCQLYSDRMRRVFREAVTKNDFESLKTAARHRYSMEHRLQELHKRYDAEQQAGWDRRAEMEQNIAFWKSIE